MKTRSLQMKWTLRTGTVSTRHARFGHNPFRRHLITFALLVPCILPGASAAQIPPVVCVGDCNHDRSATIDELITGVAITTGRAPLSACFDFDPSQDGTVSIDELIGGVGNALRGCPAARYVPAACAVPLPEGQDPADLTCGTLIVPENRAQPSPRNIEIAVAVLHATGPDPAPDPLVFLGGGPGGWVLDAALPTLTADIAAPIQSKRDIILLDQRGTGRSRPALDCAEEVVQRDLYAENLTPEEEVERDVPLLLACRDRLAAEGNALGAYSSAAIAADVADLMDALGYDQWNVYGLSYGTRVALTALRDVPERGIRSVVLDSVLPPQKNPTGFGPAVERSLRLLFADCDTDPGCRNAYPNLEQTFFQLIERFNAEPVTLMPIDPSSDEPFTVVITGDRIARLAGFALADASLLPFVPLLIRSVAQGDTTLLTLALGQLALPLLNSTGMTYSVLCFEDAPFVTPEILEMANRGVHPDILRAVGSDVEVIESRVCPLWGTPPPDPRENQPVFSTVPALILAGEYDVSTPPSLARLAAETLPNSFYFEFRGLGHVVLTQQVAASGAAACSLRLIAEFLDDPTREPDGACVGATPPPRFVGS
jgi:pimeloyl-ACP methyl ester carboxylesterase